MKIREFLCETPAAILAIVIVMASALGVEFAIMGWEIVGVWAIGAGAFGVLFVIGYGLYKLIEWAQSYCKEESDE